MRSLFSADISDLFFWDCECGTGSYEDDNTPYTSDISLQLFWKIFRKITKKISLENHMQANHDKYHLLVTIDTSVSTNINVFNIQVTGTKNNYLVPNSIVNSFENHVSNPYKKVSQTLRGLTRIVNYLDFSKRKVLIKIFVISQFNNCQLF